MASIPVYNASLALGDNPAHRLSAVQKGAMAAFALGLLAVVVALASDLGAAHPIPMLTLIAVLGLGGPLVYFWDEYRSRPAGIKHDGIMFNQNMARGLVAWVVGVVLTGLYVLLYWFPATLDGLIRVVDPLAYTLTGNPANQWFLYGT